MSNLKTVKLLVTFLLYISLGIGSANAEDGFSFEMPKEGLRIVIPDIPQITMQVHPNASLQPHARFMGSDSTGYSISILTPTCDAGMGPESCANSTFKSLISRYGLDPKAVVSLKNDSNTFVVLFPFRAGPLIQFQAYFLSGYGGTHCVEIHLSKTFTGKDKDAAIAELSDWLQKFRSAKIEVM